MKHKDFEDYLAHQHGLEYRGLDDEMPDAFGEWLQELDAEEWLEFGQKYAEIAVKQDQEKAQAIFERTFLGKSNPRKKC